MSGWFRHLLLNAQARTGFDSQLMIWGAIAAVTSIAALIFLSIAAFVWLANRYDALAAGLVLGGVFVLIALIAVVACLITRRRNMERARHELAARSSGTNWLDPKVLAIGFQIGQVVGWRKVAAMAAAGIIAAGLAKEWFGHNDAGSSEDEPRSES